MGQKAQQKSHTESISEARETEHCGSSGYLQKSFTQSCGLIEETGMVSQNAIRVQLREEAGGGRAAKSGPYAAHHAGEVCFSFYPSGKK